MIITAKYNGKCAKCGGPAPAGKEIDYVDKKAYHVGCAPEEGSGLSDEQQLELAGRLGFKTEREWDLLLLPRQANGDPAWWNRSAPSGRDSVSDVCSINDLRGEQEY